jgi:hypothetical protein
VEKRKKGVKEENSSSRCSHLGQVRREGHYGIQSCITASTEHFYLNRTFWGRQNTRKNRKEEGEGGRGSGKGKEPTR